MSRHREPSQDLVLINHPSVYTAREVRVAYWLLRVLNRGDLHLAAPRRPR